MVRPVTRAHKKMTSAAILNRIPAVVNTPMPEKAILTATALEPKRIHKNADKMPAKKENSGLSIFGLFIETTIHHSSPVHLTVIALLLVDRLVRVFPTALGRAHFQQEHT